MLLFALLPCRLAPYRGWFPVICSLCCSNFVYFYCFHSLKANWLRGKQSSSSTDLILGIAAGERHEKGSSKLTTHDKKVRAEIVVMPFICLCFPRCCECTGDHPFVGRQHEAEAAGFKVSQCRHSAHQLCRHYW